MKDATERQTEILDFIRESIATRGYPPTRIEICERFGFKSTNAAQWHLHRLIVKGLISVDTIKARGIRLHDAPPPREGREVTREIVSRRGQRFTFVEPVRDRKTGEVYFPPTPIVARPA